MWRKVFFLDFSHELIQNDTFPSSKIKSKKKKKFMVTAGFEPAPVRTSA